MNKYLVKITRENGGYTVEFFGCGQPFKNQYGTGAEALKAAIDWTDNNAQPVNR